MVPIIFSLVFLAIIIVNVIIYAKKGFVSTVLQLLTFGVALLSAILLSGPVSRLLGREGSIDALSERRSIVFVVIFIIVAILMGLLQKVLGKAIKKIPVVGSLNTALGGVVGLILGLLYAYLAVSLCAIIVAATANNPLPWMNAKILREAWLVNLIYEKFDLLTLLTAKLPTF